MNQKQRVKQLKLRNEILATKKEKTLWKWFSLYIRLRDCIESGFARCITCGNAHYFKEMDAGHFIPQKNHYNTLYEETNVHAQCKRCNDYGHGEVAKYREALIERYGIEEVERLEQASKVIAKHMILCDVESKAAYYRQKAKDEAHIQGVEIK